MNTEEIHKMSREKLKVDSTLSTDMDVSLEQKESLDDIFDQRKNHVNYHISDLVLTCHHIN